MRAIPGTFDAHARESAAFPCYFTHVFEVDEAYEKARGFILRKISGRELSSSDLRRALEKKGFDPEVAERALREFIDRGYVDDQRFSAAYVRYQAARGKGATYIRMKLRQKGVEMTAPEIDAIIGAHTEISETDRASEILERRYPGHRADRKIAQKAYAALLRRGFSPQVAIQALKRPVALNPLES